jgi:flagellar assembly protein FliH
MQNHASELENTVVDIALNLAKSLVKSEISARPDILVDTVKHCLAVLPSSDKKVRVYLNEHDVELLKKLQAPDAKEWDVLIDQNLSSGGCRVETDYSEIDYSVEQRIQSYLDKVDLLKDKPLPDDIGDVPNYAESNDPSTASSGQADIDD